MGANILRFYNRDGTSLNHIICVFVRRTGKGGSVMLSMAFSQSVMSSTATSSSSPTTVGTLETPCATTTTPTSAPSTRTMTNVWMTALPCAKVNPPSKTNLYNTCSHLHSKNTVGNFPPINDESNSFLQVVTGTTAALTQTWMASFTATASTQGTQMGSLGMAGTGQTTPSRKWRWRSGQWVFNHRCFLDHDHRHECMRDFTNTCSTKIVSFCRLRKEWQCCPWHSN